MVVSRSCKWVLIEDRVSWVGEAYSHDYWCGSFTSGEPAMWGGFVQSPTLFLEIEGRRREGGMLGSRVWKMTWERERIPWSCCAMSSVFWRVLMYGTRDASERFKKWVMNQITQTKKPSRRMSREEGKIRKRRFCVVCWLCTEIELTQNRFLCVCLCVYQWFVCRLCAEWFVHADWTLALHNTSPLRGKKFLYHVMHDAKSPSGAPDHGDAYSTNCPNEATLVNPEWVILSFLTQDTASTAESQTIGQLGLMAIGIRLPIGKIYFNIWEETS